MESRESSLTTPEDRDKVNRWKPEQTVPPLTDAETAEALSSLNNTSFTEKFPRVDRTYADPAIPLQTIGLLSFIPSKGATPNENGVYGFMKLRGNFSTQIEADQRAEYLIRNFDSYHSIFHAYVGRPFPITVNSKFAAETNEIDIRKEMTKSVSENIKDKKDEEYRTIQEIKQKEEALLADTKREDVDPYDEYITQRVKLAQLSFTYLEHQKKMAEVRDIIIKTREKVSDMDTEFPEFKNTYFEKYMEARRQAGLSENKETTEANFIKFLVEDAPLDF
jgi:Family of unknown function (DUF5832)